MKTTLKSWFQQHIVTLVVQGSSVIVLILGLWLSTKLFPITLRLKELDMRVSANESAIQSLCDDLKYIRSRVDQIYLLNIK